MAETTKSIRRRQRQEELRETLANKGLVQQVLVNLKKMDELQVVIEAEQSAQNPGKELISGQFELQKLKTSNDQRLKLINKFLPDLKQTEITGEDGEEFKVIHEIKLVSG